MSCGDVSPRGRRASHIALDLSQLSDSEQQAIRAVLQQADEAEQNIARHHRLLKEKQFALAQKSATSYQGACPLCGKPLAGVPNRQCAMCSGVSCNRCIVSVRHTSGDTVVIEPTCKLCSLKRQVFLTSHEWQEEGEESTVEDITTTPGYGMVLVCGLKTDGGVLRTFVLEAPVNGSAFKCGVMPGDEILVWCDEDIVGMSFRSVSDIICQSCHGSISLKTRRYVWPQANVERAFWVKRQSTEAIEPEALIERMLVDPVAVGYPDGLFQITDASQVLVYPNGRIKLRLNHAGSGSHLLVTVCEADRLPALKPGVMPSPSAYVSLNAGKGLVSTKECQRTGKPVWNEEMTFPLPSQIRNCTLNVSVKTPKHLFGKATLGECSINLDEALFSEMAEWYCLQPPASSMSSNCYLPQPCEETTQRMLEAHRRKVQLTARLDREKIRSQGLRARGSSQLGLGTRECSSAPGSLTSRRKNFGVFSLPATLCGSGSGGEGKQKRTSSPSSPLVIFSANQKTGSSTASHEVGGHIPHSATFPTARRQQHLSSGPAPLRSRTSYNDETDSEPYATSHLALPSRRQGSLDRGRVVMQEFHQLKPRGSGRARFWHWSDQSVSENETASEAALSHQTRSRSNASEGDQPVSVPVRKERSKSETVSVAAGPIKSRFAPMLLSDQTTAELSTEGGSELKTPKSPTRTPESNPFMSGQMSTDSPASQQKSATEFLSPSWRHTRFSPLGTDRLSALSSDSDGYGFKSSLSERSADDDGLVEILGSGIEGCPLDDTSITLTVQHSTNNLLVTVCKVKNFTAVAEKMSVKLASVEGIAVKVAVLCVGGTPQKHKTRPQPLSNCVQYGQRFTFSVPQLLHHYTLKVQLVAKLRRRGMQLPSSKSMAVAYCLAPLQDMDLQAGVEHTEAFKVFAMGRKMSHQNGGSD